MAPLVFEDELVVEPAALDEPVEPVFEVPVFEEPAADEVFEEDVLLVVREAKQREGEYRETSVNANFNV